MSIHVVGHTILDVNTAERFVDGDYVGPRSLVRARDALQVYTQMFGQWYTLRIATVDDQGRLVPLYP